MSPLSKRRTPTPVRARPGPRFLCARLSRSSRCGFPPLLGSKSYWATRRKKAAAHGATASKGAEAERAAISVPPRPRCSPPRPTGSEYSTRACMRRSRHAISADRCPLRTRTSQSMPPRSPPRLPRSLTRPRPALRAPIAFLQSSPPSSLIDSYPCPRAWVPCRPGQLPARKNGTECTATLSKGPSSTSRTANLRSFAILLLLDSKYENEYYWFTCKQPCREIFNILLKCFF